MKMNKKYIYVAISILGVYLTMRYALPLILPFLISFIIVSPMNHLLNKLHYKTKIGKGFLAGGAMIIFAVVVGFLLWFLSSQIVLFISNCVKNIDSIQAQFCIGIQNCCQLIQDSLGIEAAKVEAIIIEKIDLFVNELQVQVLPNFMNNTITYAKGIIGLVAFLAVTIISTILLAKDYDKIKDKVKEQNGYSEIFELIKKTGRMLLLFIKAQLTIMFVIGFICSIGFWIMRMPNWFGLGIITAILDVLPFIGTGIVLLPLSIVMFLQGNIAAGVGSILLYVVCAFTREMLEPRLIGDKVGIYPIIILISIYAGIKIYGLGGIILGPISVLLIMEIVKKIPEFNKSAS